MDIARNLMRTASVAAALALGWPQAQPIAAPSQGGPIAFTVRAEGVEALAPEDVSVSRLLDRTITQNRVSGTFSVAVSQAKVERQGGAVVVRLPANAVPAGDTANEGIVNLEVWVRDRIKKKQGFVVVPLVLTSHNGAQVWRRPEATQSSAAVGLVVSPVMRGVFCTSSADCKVQRGAAGKGGLVLPVSATRRAPLKAPWAGKKLPKSGPPGCRNALDPYYYPDLKKITEVTIGTTYPTKSSPGYMHREARDEDSKSWAATLGVAATKGHLGGSVKKSGSTGLTRTTGFRWNPSTKNRSYRARVRYERFRLYEGCRLLKDFPELWRPTALTGTTSEHFLKGRKPDWKKNRENCDVQKSGGEFRRETTDHFSYENSGGVKLTDEIGVDLSVSRRYSDQAIVVYDFPKMRLGKRSTYRWLCGNNALPDQAGKIAVHKKIPR